MKNQSFKEKCLIFQTPGPKSAPPEAEKALVVPPVKPVEAKPAEDSKKIEELEKVHSQMGLGESRAKMEGGFKDKIKTTYTVLLEELNLGNQVIDGLKLSGNLDFNDKDFKAIVKSRIRGVLDKVTPEKFAKIADALGQISDKKLEIDGAKEFMAAIYANSFVRKIDKAIKNEETGYPLFDQFKKTPRGNCVIEITGEFDGSTDFKNLSFVVNDQFQKAYEEFKNDLKTNPEKPKEASTSNLPDVANSLSKHPAGRALIALGVVREYSSANSDIVAEYEAMTTKEQNKYGSVQKYVEHLNNQEFESALNGENFFAGLVIWLSGGAGILSDKGAGYQSFADSLDPKYGAIIVQAKGTLSKSPIALEKFATANPLKQGTEGIPPKMNNEKFEGIMKAGGGTDHMPKEGLTLESEYDLSGQTLAVNFEAGGTVTLPKGTSMYVDGNNDKAGEANVDYPKSSVAKEIKITGKIPAGVIFKGSTAFKLEKI